MKLVSVCHRKTSAFAEAFLSYEGGDSVTIGVVHLSVIYDTGKMCQECV